MPAAVARRAGLPLPAAPRTKYTSSVVIKKLASIVTYEALSNSLYQLCGFSWELCRSPEPLRPVRPHEHRVVVDGLAMVESAGQNGWKLARGVYLILRS